MNYIKKLIYIKNKYNYNNMNQYTDCNICVESINKEKICKCPFCLYECCTDCLKKYTIENQLKTEKTCMNCHRKFNRTILINLFGKNYIDNLYKNHIKELLFKEEKILIPKILPIITNIKEQQKYIQIANQLREDYYDYDNYSQHRGTLEGYKKFYEITAYESYAKNINTSVRNIISKKNTIEYKFPCANNDCNGFVNSKWICNVCEKETCKHCHILKNDDNHECKKEDIDTANLIKKESKPCPKCNISIMKTSGCDQMWCVSCHTTFDWKTLQINKNGILHNPEYFRYMRENGLVIQRNPNDNPCENIYHQSTNKLSIINRKFMKDYNWKKTYYNPSIRKFENEYLLNKKATDKVKEDAKIWAKKKLDEANIILKEFTISDAIEEYYIKKLLSIYEEINHFNNVELINNRLKLQDYDYWKDELRIKFVQKELTEKQYKTNLATKFKNIEFLEEIISIQETIIEVYKNFYINTISTLEDDINNAIQKRKKLILDKNKQYIKTKEFILELISKINSVKSDFGYTRHIWFPIID